MKAILMAAGTSQRLRPLTNDVPKTLLSLGSQSIFEYILSSLLKNNITHVDIITGHGHNAVVEAVEGFQKQHPEMHITCHFNDEYASTGNIVSARKAMDVIDEDFVLINSDTIFHTSILEKLLAAPEANAMIIDDVKTLGDEEMKVLLHPKQQTITHIHKSLSPHDAHGEYIGVLKLSHEVKNQIIEALDSTIARDNSLYYEDGLQTLITDHGVQIHPISTEGLPAMEIDTPEDLEEAKQMHQTIQSE